MRQEIKMNYLMKFLLGKVNRFERVILHLLIILPFSFTAIAQDFPEKPSPPRLVNDYAEMLNQGEEDILEQKLVAYNDSTSTQIAVVTRKSLNGYDAAEYAFELGRKWGIGQQGKNNGVLILVSLEDRHSFIAVGYGLEGRMPDGAVGRIRDEYLRSNLKAGRYFDAFDQTTSALIQLAAGEFKAPPQKQRKEKGGSLVPLFVFALIFLFVILPILRRGRGVRRSHFGGGGLNWLTTLFLLNSMGRGGSRDGGSWGDFSGGKGDFGGGGGFGGFGGGSFGGGGAGGDW